MRTIHTVQLTYGIYFCIGICLVFDEYVDLHVGLLLADNAYCVTIIYGIKYSYMHYVFTYYTNI